MTVASRKPTIYRRNVTCWQCPSEGLRIGLDALLRKLLESAFLTDGQIGMDRIGHLLNANFHL